MTLMFDAATHTYRVNGRVVPSVTQVLETVRVLDVGDYSRDGDDAQAARMQRGTDIHAWTRAYDVDPVAAETSAVATGLTTAPYCAAYRQALADLTPVTLWAEQPLYDAVLRVAGTPDRVWRFVDHGAPVDAVVDLKTGDPDSWHRYQLAGYRALFRANPELARELGLSPRLDGYGLYLGALGTYRLVRYPDAPREWAAFAVTAHVLRQLGR